MIKSKHNIPQAITPINCIKTGRVLLGQKHIHYFEGNLYTSVHAKLRGCLHEPSKPGSRNCLGA